MIEAGKQPWDIIVGAGYGPIFAAGNTLKYVRRYAVKNDEDDLKKGRWYSARLFEALGRGEPDALKAALWLSSVLTDEEIKLLRENQ